MPRKAARIYLLVESILGQRVKDISEEHAEMHGFEGYYDYSYIPGEAVMQPEEYHSAYRQFGRSYKQNLWLFTYKVSVLSKSGRPDNLNQ